MNRKIKKFKNITPYNIKITANEAKKQALRWEKPVDRLNQMLDTIDAINESNKILNAKLKATNSKAWRTRYKEQLRANELATRDIANELITDYGVLKRNTRTGEFTYNKYWINDIEDIMLDRRLDTIKLMSDISGGSLQDISSKTPRQAARLEELAMQEFNSLEDYNRALNEYNNQLSKSRISKVQSSIKLSKRKANKARKSKRKAQRKARKINRRR